MAQGAYLFLTWAVIFTFLKSRKTVNFPSIFYFTPSWFFSHLQKIKNWPEVCVVKSTVCIVILFFFTKVRMSRLLLWRTQYSKELPRIMPHELFFLWSRTHIFLFLTKVWHESSCLCPLLKVASQTFHLLDLNILSYAHHFWLFRTPLKRLVKPSFSILDFSLNQLQFRFFI